MASISRSSLVRSLALLGPNGAGKTTSFRMTTGQITPNEGLVYFNAEDVTRLPMYMRARLGMGYLSQGDKRLSCKLNVEQNILAILEILPVVRSLGRKMTRQERWDRTDQILEQFGLTRVRKNNAARLSGGEKRRLEIARCLVCEPLLILLDEPFTGIDPITIADIRQIVRDLRNTGIGVLLTDHNVREALKITDRSYLIKDGKVRTHGSPHEIVNDPIAIKEYLGEGFSDDFFMHARLLRRPAPGSRSTLRPAASAGQRGPPANPTNATFRSQRWIRTNPPAATGRGQSRGARAPSAGARENSPSRRTTPHGRSGRRRGGADAARHRHR